MIPVEAEELIQQGFCFELYERFSDGFQIRFYKHPDTYKIIDFKYRLCPYTRDYALHEIYEGKLVDADMSRQMVQFVIHYHEKIRSIENWIGWRNDINLLKMFNGSHEEIVHLADFENERSEYAKIDFPDIIAPVARIILEYAEYSLYEFLKKKYKIFSKRLDLINKKSQPDAPSENARILQILSPEKPHRRNLSSRETNRRNRGNASHEKTNRRNRGNPRKAR